MKGGQSNSNIFVENLYYVYIEKIIVQNILAKNYFPYAYILNLEYPYRNF